MIELPSEIVTRDGTLSDVTTMSWYGGTGYADPANTAEGLWLAIEQSFRDQGIAVNSGYVQDNDYGQFVWYVEFPVCVDQNVAAAVVGGYLSSVSVTNVGNGACWGSGMIGSGVTSGSNSGLGGGVGHTQTSTTGGGGSPTPSQPGGSSDFLKKFADTMGVGAGTAVVVLAVGAMLMIGGGRK